jgi:hypothetical protein
VKLARVEELLLLLELELVTDWNVELEDEDE